MSAAEDNRDPIDATPASHAADDVEPAPDSSVRPIDSSAIETPLPPGLRALPLTVRVSSALLGNEKSAYVTLTTPEGDVLFEGFTEDDGALDVVVLVEMTTESVHALVEAGTKYRNATIAICAPGERTEHTFI